MRAICKEVDSLVKKCGKPKMTDAIKLPPAELYKHVEVYSPPTHTHKHQYLYNQAHFMSLFIFVLLR